MGPRLLYCMAFCLLGAGHTGARVIQSPRYQVTGIGKQASLSCSQNLNHDAMYWYQQKPNQAPKLLLYYYDSNLYTEKDTSDNFKASRTNSSFCSLDILLAGFEDTAVYLCASSKDTELGCYLSPDHKPLCFSDPRSFERPPSHPTAMVGCGFMAVTISSLHRSWAETYKNH
uniref:Immunoglobulin V-set domain-containing protein n=1 Tax=Panthera leo TaxID=9689 RepID=A0A8C8X627_PANLE